MEDHGYCYSCLSAVDLDLIYAAVYFACQPKMPLQMAM